MSTWKVNGLRFCVGIRNSWERPFDSNNMVNLGVVFSELLPQLSRHADDIAVIKTLHTEHFNHAPAQLFFQTGFRTVRPSYDGVVDQLWSRE